MDVPWKRIDQFIDRLCVETGLDPEEGPMPFTDNSIDWSDYVSEPEDEDEKVA